MEPTSVRNKPEYLSTAAGFSFEDVFPEPGWSSVRIINLWKTWFHAGSIYVIVIARVLGIYGSKPTRV